MKSIKKMKIYKYRKGVIHKEEDLLATEELLEIFIDDIPFMVTMRLPGEDENLVRGICFTEGIIDSLEDIKSIEPCPKDMGKNKIVVRLNYGSKPSVKEFCFSRSSCGLCGKNRMKEINVDLKKISSFNKIDINQLFILKELFEKNMEFFSKTGCVHASAIFNKSLKLLAFSEDIGRHNALDKTIGKVLNKKMEKEVFICLMSSRLSFEIVQKAARIGTEILAGVSAPTSLAVEMADSLNITLIGFLRDNRMNIYTHPKRLFNEKG